jgi:hypothetical protein
MNELSRPVAASLPATASEFAAAYSLKRATTLHDMVEQIVRVLIDDPTFRKLIEAVYDEDTVEGSTYLDDAEAARMIRQYAADHDAPSLVMEAKLKTLIRSLTVVLRRFNNSRADRRGE